MIRQRNHPAWRLIFPTAKRLPRQLRQLPEHGANALAPFFAERGEVLIALIEATTLPYLETVSFVAHEVDGHSHGQIAAHGRIERDEHAFGGLRQAGGGFDDPLDDGFSVLRLPRLEERRVELRFDEIAFCIGTKKPQ